MWQEFLFSPLVLHMNFFIVKICQQDIFVKITQLSSSLKSSGPSLNKNNRIYTNLEKVARKDFLPPASFVYFTLAPELSLADRPLSDQRKKKKYGDCFGPN